MKEGGENWKVRRDGRDKEERGKKKIKRRRRVQRKRRGRREGEDLEQGKNEVLRIE